MNSNEFDITRQFNDLINKWYSSALADPTIKSESETNSGNRRVVVAERNLKTESAANEALTNASVTQAPAPVDFGGKKLNPIERNELYSETVKLASDLEKLINAYIKEKKDTDWLNDDPSNWLDNPENWLFDDPDIRPNYETLFTKLLNLLHEVEKQSENHPQWQSEALAQWIARNTTHEHKARADDYTGAYKPFHQLLQVINKISENVLMPSNEMNVEPESLEIRPLENGLPYVDQTALKYVDEYKNINELNEKVIGITNMPEEILAQISESLSPDELLALRETSKSGAKAIDSAFITNFIVNGLNSGRIESFTDIGIDSYEKLIDLLGDAAKYLQTLGEKSLQNVDAYALDRLAKCFPNLTHLALDGGKVYPLKFEFNNLKFLTMYNMADADSVENILNACPNLTSYKSTSQFSEKLFSVERPNITNIHFDSTNGDFHGINDIELELNLTHIDNFPNLQSLSIYDCIVTDYKPLAKCKSLVSFNATVYEPSEFDNIMINGDLPNLKVFQTNAILEDYSFLKQAELEEFGVEFTEDMTNLDFLDNSSLSLTSLNMNHFDPQVLSSLKKFPNLTTLVLREPFDYEDDVIFKPLDFSGILECKKLEVLEMEYCNVGDFEQLRKMPSLKEVRIILHHMELAEKDKKAIKDLLANGVKVAIRKHY